MNADTSSGNFKRRDNSQNIVAAKKKSYNKIISEMDTVLGKVVNSSDDGENQWTVLAPEEAYQSNFNLADKYKIKGAI